VDGLNAMSDPTCPSGATSEPHKRGFLFLFSIISAQIWGDVESVRVKGMHVKVA
jgi:hypothetical protein